MNDTASCLDRVFVQARDMNQDNSALTLTLSLSHLLTHYEVLCFPCVPTLTSSLAVGVGPSAFASQ